MASSSALDPRQVRLAPTEIEGASLAQIRRCDNCDETTSPTVIFRGTKTLCKKCYERFVVRRVQDTLRASERWWSGVRCVIVYRSTRTKALQVLLTALKDSLVARARGSRGVDTSQLAPQIISIIVPRTEMIISHRDGDSITKELNKIWEEGCNGWYSGPTVDVGKPQVVLPSAENQMPSPLRRLLPLVEKCAYTDSHLSSSGNFLGSHMLVRMLSLVEALHMNKATLMNGLGRPCSSSSIVLIPDTANESANYILETMVLGNGAASKLAVTVTSPASHILPENYSVDRNSHLFASADSLNDLAHKMGVRPLPVSAQTQILELRKLTSVYTIEGTKEMIPIALIHPLSRVRTLELSFDDLSSPVASSAISPGPPTSMSLHDTIERSFKAVDARNEGSSDSVLRCMAKLAAFNPLSGDVKSSPSVAPLPTVCELCLGNRPISEYTFKESDISSERETLQLCRTCRYLLDHE